MATFQVIINEKGGQSKSLDFDKSEVTIGRVQGNDIVLPKGNISKKHSRIVVKDGKFIIIDMQSTNGTYVNGKKITTPQVVKSTDKIYIGDFTLQLSPMNGSAQADGPPPPSTTGPKQRAPSRAQDELDLFDEKGADADAAPRGGAGPGLIDDNFDQEFEGTVEPEPQKPSRGAPAKRAKPEPEPEPEPDLDLDLEGAAANGDGLLDPGFDEPAEEPQKVVSMKAGRSAGRGPTSAAAAGAQKTPTPASPPSRTKAAGTSKPAAKPGRIEEEEPSPVTPPPAVIIPPAPANLAPAAVAPAALASVAPVAIAAAAGPALDLQEAARQIQWELLESLGLRGKPLVNLHQSRAAVEAAARKSAERLRNSGRISAHESIDELARQVAHRTVDLEAIADLLGEDGVHEIVVTNGGEILAEREGQLSATGRSLRGEQEVIDLIRCLAALGGVEDFHQRSLFDVRLRDGSRLVASLPPLAFRGPTFSLRKTAREAFTLEALVQHGTLSEPMTRFLEYCVRYKKGVLLSVGPGVGASATLNALGSQAPIDERVVTIELGVEVHPAQTNVTALEPSAGLGLTELIRHAVAMQPDRALIGLIGGEGTAEVIDAMAGPLEGSIACYTAATPAGALERLATLELRDRFTDPEAAKRWIARAAPVVVQEHRFPDGSRRITQIAELRAEGETVTAEDLFLFEPEGADENGLITGSFKPTGTIPKFVEELNERGLEVNLGIFQG